MAGKPLTKPRLELTPEQRAVQTAKVLELKLAGWRQDQIATELGLSEQVVSVRIKAALNAMVQPASEELRKEEIARLDKYLKALDDQIENGALTHDQRGNEYVDESKRAQAIATAVRVAERRAKLLGIDMPSQLEVKHEHVGSIEAEIAKLAAELAMDVTASDESEKEDA